ncbi:NACHT domain-containing protein [Oculatella sp. FACHB-28]|uniref:NACHT domain-containing protein n=1 Tax=Oculatella sp. FACHB-28 TaxID=2692845 RepID=UPI0016871245|nr:NACHT domain-containing protein [Oculatella sp. FACHB-28]MBD2057666.1 NACHT domain-containing protein [Oculatella sp. FACHB-28]
MAFSVPFLTELVKEKQLTDRETEVFLALFGKGKTRLEIAESLYVQESAVNTCLTGIYRKFGISGSGPVKENRLKDELRRREEIWQKQRATDSSDRPSPFLQPLDNLTHQVREHCRQKILNQHSRMRLLSGEEISVDQLYVDVWILKRPPHTYQVSQLKLLETFDLRNDRLGMGDRIQRIEGFEFADKNPKLVILGKPGSGKTTFLKHLAVDWCSDRFQPDLIAVLIEFRQIRAEQWQLLNAIGEELGLDEGYQIRTLKEQIKQLQRSILSLEEKQQQKKQIEALQQQLNALPLQVLLTQGKLLILMDGLDEVPTSNLRRNVQDQLREIAEDYPKNRFTLTCRTQVITPIPVGFTSVEVAEFSPEQVQQFVQNWFKANGKSETIATQQWETIKNAVDNSSALQELTLTPVLLSLTCLVLQDEGEIPSDRNWLYQKGIKLMLNRWNEEKPIDDWELGNETYRRLSIEQKENLLMTIAAHKFENPKNFVLFKQDEIADQITQLLHLVNRQEGVAALKTIEAQHGLLIERADELWSFSHLTFQEYFTFQWLIRLPPKQLAEKIANQQWQEVVKQLVKSQQPADRLLRLIKQAIDQSIVHESKITQFLTWVFQKAESIQAPYRSAAIRAFYFALDCAIARAFDRTFAYIPDLARAFDRTLARVLDLACAFDRAIALDVALVRALTRDRIHPRTLHVDLDLARPLARDRTFISALARDRKFSSELTTQIEQLRGSLPKDPIKFWRWWQTNGEQWVEQLRQVMIEYRNLGHDWQFTEVQRQQLQRYYDANKFLVDLMKIEGAVSGSVRAEIEDTLLLPWNELQRRQSN